MAKKRVSQKAYDRAIARAKRSSKRAYDLARQAHNPNYLDIAVTVFGGAGAVYLEESGIIPETILGVRSTGVIGLLCIIGGMFVKNKNIRKTLTNAGTGMLTVAICNLFGY